MAIEPPQNQAPLAVSPPYQGRHVLADFYDCAAKLDDAAVVEQGLRAAVTAAGATLLDIRLHHFGPGHGVTGIAILAESHISIHTWPEHRYVALDLFMCGAANDVDAGLAAIAQILLPDSTKRWDHRRGYNAAVTATL